MREPTAGSDRRVKDFAVRCYRGLEQGMTPQQRSELVTEGVELAQRAREERRSSREHRLLQVTAALAREDDALESLLVKLEPSVARRPPGVVVATSRESAGGWEKLLVNPPSGASDKPSAAHSVPPKPARGREGRAGWETLPGREAPSIPSGGHRGRFESSTRPLPRSPKAGAGAGSPRGPASQKGSSRGTVLVRVPEGKRHSGKNRFLLVGALLVLVGGLALLALLAFSAEDRAAPRRAPESTGLAEAEAAWFDTHSTGEPHPPEPPPVQVALQHSVLGAPNRREFERRVAFFALSAAGRKWVERFLRRCASLEGSIQSELSAAGLPRGVLAVVGVESGCNPKAKSPVGALGLWQFMPATARAYGLRVPSEQLAAAEADERTQPGPATRAAARFIGDLYERYGDWELALAAYNLGPGGVRRRLVNARVGSFWGLVDSGALPRETADYVPRVQALAHVLLNLDKFGFSRER